MILKPTNYDEVQAYTGEFETIAPGGYICVIQKAEAVTTAKGNLPMLTILFDIAEGDSKGFYERQWKSDEGRANRKWRGVYNQITEGKSVPFFKGLITSIEESNAGYKWNWDEKTLEGKLFGGVFGREQYRKQDGKLAMATKCVSIRSVKAIRDGVEAPEDKLLTLDDTYDAPHPLSTTPTANWQEINSDDELPF